MTGPLVLVVDDDEDLRSLLEVVLEGAGFRVAQASNGVHALAAVRAEKPALILLDLRMPVMDGRAFAAALRLEDPAPPPIVVLTAATDPGKRAAEVCAEAWLPKPFAYADLVSLVGRLVTRQRPDTRHAGA